MTFTVVSPTTSETPQGLVEQVARALCSNDAKTNRMQDGRLLEDLVWKVHVEDAKKAIAVVTSSMNQEMSQLQLENQRMRGALEALKSAVDNSIRPIDEPNRVILKNGNIIEGEAADVIHRILISARKLAVHGLDTNEPPVYNRLNAEIAKLTSNQEIIAGYAFGYGMICSDQNMPYERLPTPKELVEQALRLNEEKPE